MVAAVLFTAAVEHALAAHIWEAHGILAVLVTLVAPANFMEVAVMSVHRVPSRDRVDLAMSAAQPIVGLVTPHVQPGVGMQHVRASLRMPIVPHV